MTKRATAGLSAGVLILAGLLAGCSDDGDDGGDGGDDQSASDFADQSYDEIKKAAIEAMGELESVHIDAEISSGGQDRDPRPVDERRRRAAPALVSFGAVVRGGAAGRRRCLVQAEPGAAEPSSIRDSAPEALAFVGDSWVADTNGEVTPSNCDLEAFIEQVTSDEEEETDTEVGDVEDFEGDDVVPLTFTNDDGDGTVYVLAEGDHYIAKFAVEGENPGTVTFSEFNEEVETEAPAEDEIVDLADFKG